MKMGKEFNFYQIGMFLSIVGNSFSMIALSWWILTVSQSAVTMSLVLTPALLIKVFLSPLFGPIGDTYNRRKLIIFSCIWLAGAMGTLAFLAYKNIFILSVVIAIYIFKSIGSAVQSSVIIAYVANIVGQESISKAMVRNRIVFMTGNILGYSLGGLVVSSAGVTPAFFIDMLSFLLCACFIFLIKKERNIQKSVDNTSTFVEAFFRWKNMLFDGIKSSFQLRILFFLALIFMVLNFAVAPMSILIPLLVKSSGKEAWLFGIIEVAFGIGAILAGIILGILMEKVRHDILVLIAFLFIGPSFYLLSVGSFSIAPIIGMFGVGLFLSIGNVIIDSKILSSIPDHYRSRISTSLDFFASLAAPLGVLLAGRYTEIIGAQQIVLGIAVVFIIMVPALFVIPNFMGFLRCQENEGYNFLRHKYPEWTPKEH